MKGMLAKKAEERLNIEDILSWLYARPQEIPPCNQTAPPQIHKEPEDCSLLETPNTSRVSVRYLESESSLESKCTSKRAEWVLKGV